MVVFMMALIFIFYICMGLVLILADSMTVNKTYQRIFSNDLYFSLAVFFWPFVIVWAKWKWHHK